MSPSLSGKVKLNLLKTQNNTNMEFTNPLKPISLKDSLGVDNANYFLSKTEGLNPVLYKDTPMIHSPLFWVGYWRSTTERMLDDLIRNDKQITDLKNQIEELKKINQSTENNS